MRNKFTAMRLLIFLLLVGAGLSAQAPLDSIVAHWEGHEGLGSDNAWPQWTAEEREEEVRFLRGTIFEL